MFSAGVLNYTRYAGYCIFANVHVYQWWFRLALKICVMKHLLGANACFELYEGVLLNKMLIFKMIKEFPFFGYLFL